MKIFTCRICGEVYLGKSVPSSCPFCGANNKYLVLSKVWQDENNIELSGASRKNLEEALRIELSNSSFYKCASEAIASQEIAKMFKGLFKVEREHASVFKKLLRLSTAPEIEEKCDGDVAKTLSRSLAREKMAVDFYSRALAAATEPRVREVFSAIMEVEKDHIELDNLMSERFKK